jgi:hypothetical protein
MAYGLSTPATARAFGRPKLAKRLARLKKLRFQDSWRATPPGLQTCTKAVAIPVSNSSPSLAADL